MQGYEKNHYLVGQMKKKVVIAIDSFKGSLSSREAAEALLEGVRSVVGECEVDIVPVADGGEGTAEILTEALGGGRQRVWVHDALGRPIEADYGLCGEVAFVDVASAVGLTLLSDCERNPLKTTSLGVGEMIADALARGARRILLGVGGSATNDCAMGLLEGLGFRFLDSSGEAVRGCGGSLERVVRIDDDGVVPHLREATIELLADVDNPLCGPRGAAAVFAPQKGASKENVVQLERGVRHFAEVLTAKYGLNPEAVKGAGAAGGIAGGLWSSLGAEIRVGVEAVLESVGFESRAADANLIITGEGKVDNQTLMGKVPCGVLRHGVRLGVPTVAVGGSVEWSEKLHEAGFAAIVAATPEGMSLGEAMRPEVARMNLRRVAEDLARQWLV